MDLESYMSRYSGETRLQRLLVIAQSMTSDETLAAQAFDMAEKQMKENRNVVRYTEVFGWSEQQQQQQQLQQQSTSEGAAESSGGSIPCKYGFK